MEALETNLIGLLEYLLPGFLMAWVFYGLTSHPMPTQFERVIQALVFTIFIQAAVYVAKILAITLGEIHSIGTWDPDIHLFISVTSAIGLGFLFAYFANNDKFHALLRRYRLTKQTSFPSEWYGAFNNRIDYAVIRLKEQRSLYGWIVEWPSSHHDGHFLLAEPSWIDSDGQEVPMTGVEAILISAEDISWVQFMKSENCDGQERIQSPATTTTENGQRDQ